MAGSAIGSIGSALAGKAVGGLFGGGSTASAGAVAPPMFKAGGIFNKIKEDGKLIIKQTDERKNLIDNLKAGFLNQADSIRNDLIPRFEDLFREGAANVDNLLSQVSPGFGRLTESRVRAIDDARQRGLSNLTDNLARRRVSGSSFAQNSLIAAENEFAKQEEDARARSFLEELELTNQLETQKLEINNSAAERVFALMQEAFASERGADQVELEEQNRLADVGLGLLDMVLQQQNRNADLAVNDTVSANQLGGQIAGQIFGSIF